MPSILALPLIIIIVQFNSKVSPYYLQPYPADILDQLPPLQFPGPVSVGNVSDLGKNLSDVEKQMEVISAAGKALGANPFVSEDLGQVSAILVDHLESAVALEDLDTAQKTKLGIQADVFVQHKIRHFQADVRVLRRRLQELFNSNATDEMKRLSTIPAIQVCERILELFVDEKYWFWERKLIFFPYLISFATLYGMAATAAGKLVPYKVPYLEKDMDLLQATVLKYHPLVKAQRMSNFTITKTRVLRYKDALSGKLEDMALHCPIMQILKQQPSPFRSCVLGGTKNASFWQQTQQTFNRQKVQADRAPEWFQDTVTGQIFCGWEGCWNSLHEDYGNKIDNLTMSALMLLPYNKPPNELPQAEKTGADCHTDGYGRLEHMDIPWRDSYRNVHEAFRCESDKFCRKMTSYGWAYTTKDEVREKVRCESNEDCCPEWNTY